MDDTNPECGVFKIDDLKFPPLSQPEITTSQSNIMKADAPPCLCGASKSKAAKIKCGMCTRVWHGGCVGLKGGTVHLLNKLESNGWVCPKCFVFADEVIEAFKEESIHIEPKDIDKVGLMITKEISAVIPKVVAGVEEKIKEGCFDDVFKDAGRVVSKSWADTARSDQNKIIEEAVQATSNVALKQSMRLLDSNLTERQKRSRNIVISNVAENSEGDTLGDVICNKLREGLTKEDILSCNRLGKKGEKPRAILCVMRREDDAVFFTNNGKGRKFTGDVWVNPDLTRTERDALYEKREARRVRNRNKTTLPAEVVTGRNEVPTNMDTDLQTISVDVHVEPDVVNEESNQPQQTTEEPAPTPAAAQPAADVSRHLNDGLVADSSATK